MKPMHSLYHIAKVVEVFAKNPSTVSSDSSVQAQLEMWDDNLIIFGVHAELSAMIQKGQFVLVEYGYHAPNVPVNTVIKILESKQGEQSWKRMKAFLEKRKKQMDGMSEENIQDISNQHGMIR
mgnify:CR=1 FL=1